MKQQTISKYMRDSCKEKTKKALIKEVIHPPKNMIIEFPRLEQD